MASWIDIFSLLMTTLFFVGVVLGVLYASQAFSSSVQSTKASLEQRGITLSRDGVSLKTQKRFDREAYLDATQRGLVKALGAATVGPESHKQAVLPPAAEERDKWRVFGMALRKSHGDERSGGRQ
ncbi:hypothetical protein OG21DRAFT_1487498 [Imleria badia]|nr:hypothetical protein OG21DRAFT_1487498 [Imleria badia]